MLLTLWEDTGEKAIISAIHILSIGLYFYRPHTACQDTSALYRRRVLCSLGDGGLQACTAMGTFYCYLPPGRRFVPYTCCAEPDS